MVSNWPLYLRNARYFHMASTLGIHPTRSVVFNLLYQQNLTRLNLRSIMLSLNHTCSGLLRVPHDQNRSASGCSCSIPFWFIVLILVLILVPQLLLRVNRLIGPIKVALPAHVWTVPATAFVIVITLVAMILISSWLR